MTEKRSISGSLNWTDIRKVLIGAVLAAIGAALTYLSEWISGTDFGEWTPIVVAVWSVVANFLRKLIAGPFNPEKPNGSSP